MGNYLSSEAGLALASHVLAKSYRRGGVVRRLLPVGVKAFSRRGAFVNNTRRQVMQQGGRA